MLFKNKSKGNAFTLGNIFPGVRSKHRLSNVTARISIESRSRRCCQRRNFLCFSAVGSANSQGICAIRGAIYSQPRCWPFYFDLTPVLSGHILWGMFSLNMCSYCLPIWDKLVALPYAVRFMEQRFQTGHSVMSRAMWHHVHLKFLKNHQGNQCHVARTQVKNTELSFSLTSSNIATIVFQFLIVAKRDPKCSAETPDDNPW